MWSGRSPKGERRRKTDLKGGWRRGGAEVKEIELKGNSGREGERRRGKPNISV